MQTLKHTNTSLIQSKLQAFRLAGSEYVPGLLHEILTLINKLILAYGWNSPGRTSLLEECHQNVCTLGLLTRSVLIKNAWFSTENFDFFGTPSYWYFLISSFPWQFLTRRKKNHAISMNTERVRSPRVQTFGWHSSFSDIRHGYLHHMSSKTLLTLSQMRGGGLKFSPLPYRYH